jgi:hypothetical protein
MCVVVVKVMLATAIVGKCLMKTQREIDGCGCGCSSVVMVTVVIVVIKVVRRKK